MGKTFSERLAEQIKLNNYSQKRLAEKAGVTEAAMSHYIKGDRFPRANVLARIADALGTTSDYLMNGKAISSDDEVQQAKRLIARNVAQMSKDEKMEIVRILMSGE